MINIPEGLAPRVHVAAGRLLLLNVHEVTVHVGVRGLLEALPTGVHPVDQAAEHVAAGQQLAGRVVERSARERLVPLDRVDGADQLKAGNSSMNIHYVQIFSPG